MLTEWHQKVLIFAHEEQMLEPICLALAQEKGWDVLVSSPHDKAHVTQILTQFNPQYVIVLRNDSIMLPFFIAEECIRLKIHYMDTSEDPAHITKMLSLNDAAKAQAVVIMTGVNKVPALSSVVVDRYVSEFSTLREIYCGISPANLSKGDQSEIGAIMPDLGEPFTRLEGGVWKTVYGWQDLHRRYYGDNMGYRWHANRNVPDLTLLPERYPGLKSVVFHGGMEATSMHWLLWTVSWLRRIRLFKHSHWMTKCFTRINRWFSGQSQHVCGMYIQMLGVSQEYQPLEIKWSLVAEMGQGDELGAIIALLVLRNIRDRRIEVGAQACLGFFSMAEFDTLLASKPIYQIVEQSVM